MKKLLLLAKASSIPPDAHWITVHPNGPSSKGQPVLIQPQPDGSAKVIGGAGGSLNHLRLRGVKSKDSYKSEAKEKAADRRQKKQEQAKADKQSGTYEAKQAQRKSLKEKKRSAERHVINAVAEKAGWDKSDLAFPEEDYAHLSEPAMNKVRDRHHKALLKRAKEVIQQSRDRLVTDSSAREQAGIGEVPLFSDKDEHLSVQDLDPSPATRGGLGFKADYKGRAEDSGLTDEALKNEATQVKLAGMTEAQRKASFARGESANLIKQELEGIKMPAAPDADASLLAAQDALDLVKEGRRLAQIEKAAQSANADIDKGVEPKAFVIQSSDDAELDKQAREAIESDLRTTQTVSFLSEVGKISGGNPTETLGGHIGVGAYNSINSLSMAVGGDALVDRSVVDVLGIAGAAQVLARRLHSDLTPSELQHVAEGTQDWHVNHYMQTSTEALKKARDLQKAAQDIELSEEATNGADLQLAQELNARRRAAIGDAQRIMGQAMGEMEANAALVASLKQKPSDSMDFSLGKTSPESAIQQLRAIGLLAGDYKLERVDGNVFATVTGQGLDRLAKPVNREDVQQVRRNLGIIAGEQDEDGWMPLNTASRPDLAMNVKPGVAERFSEPFQPTDDLEQSLQTYIGARAADGDAPADILADIQSADFFSKVGNDRTAEYREALNAVAPIKGADGKMQRAEALADTFDKYADAHIASLGGQRSTLNKQKFQVDQKAVDALHRALSETPEGVAAYKQIGELSGSDQRALRQFFGRNIAKDGPDGQKLKSDLSAHEANEPEKESTDMFGETMTSPAWQDWKSERDELAAKVNESTLTWSKYVTAMGGNAKAYEAVQDHIRSSVASAFVDAHNKMNPKSPMKLGKRVIRNNLDHLDAVDPKAREQRAAEQKDLIDSMRARVQGKYASGSVSDKLSAQKEEQAAYGQAQMGFFSSEEVGAKGGDLASDERHTLGHAAERQIAGMMEHVGQNFKPGQPTKLWNVSMSGKYVAQQRLIKHMAANKRTVAAAGAGSGKTNVMLGAHAHLSGLGKVKRSLMLVPSVVQGQFSGEALRLLEPGKFKTHIQPGASREERIAAYKDPDTHIAVMTHQSFRDDMVHLGAQHAGIDEEAMTTQLSAMTPAQRKEWISGVMSKEGINFDASFVDEAHDTLNRAGKDNSSLANVIEATGHHTPYHLYASGDPVKNDASEVHSMMQKMDPERYQDRSEFMRRYGADTIASKDALRREMARYVFPTSITPDVNRDRKIEKVPLSAGQQKAISELSGHIAKVKSARKAGKVDIDAAKGISPDAFDGIPESEHEGIAERIQNSVGIVKSTAYNRIINSHPDNAKVQHAVNMVKQREGKQGVIFARNRAAVEQYKAALEKEGKRVVTITGSDSGKDKDSKRRLFNPESGDAKADIMVASDAAAVGMNLQSGQYLIQHDISDTAKTHSQRNARIDRIGQGKDIELIDLHGDHPEERKAYERLQKKYALKDMMAEPMDGLDDTGIAGAIRARQLAAEHGEPLL